MTTQVSTTAVAHGNHEDAEYNDFLARVNTRFLANCAGGAWPLFTTDASGLWDAYLGSFTDPEVRQYHNCHACRQFIERFGGLVTIDEEGVTKPAIWDEDDAPEAYKPALVAMAQLVRRARVTGVFLASSPVWGTPETGVWRHFAVRPVAGMVFKRATQTADQAMAEKREDFQAVTRALGEITQIHLEMAIALLKTDALYRSEKVLGQAEWLHALHTARDAAHGGTRKANVVWRAVATAPAGFCHPRSSMIGTLLEDIAAGMRYEEVASRFAAKMHPLRYQPPQAAPKAGTIDAAEKVVQQLNAAGSLARRFCRVDEVQALWRPSPKKNETPVDGVFGHLKPKPVQPTTNIRIPAQTMTWDKFQRTVLPTAERIEFKAPSPGPYVALVTAVHPDAPPILQWDRDGARNPVSWYFWDGGSTAASFGLRGGQFYDVEAITLKPSMWNGGFEHQGAGVMFVIAGERESRMAGAAIFPETLKAEFHGIRSVIEAYSRRASIQGMNEPHAAGIMLTKGNSWDAALRVRSAGRSLDYRLDRWD